MDAPPVQYVRTSDGFDIAYAVMGEGPPLVCVSFPFSHIRLYWTAPGDVRAWFERAATSFRIIYYDARGLGLSSRGLGPDVTIDSFVSDLEAITDKLGMERCVLFGFGFVVGHAAIHFAAKHPERVEALILMTTSLRGDAWPRGIFEELASQNWDAFLERIAPRGTSLEDHELNIKRLEQSVTQDDWLTTWHAFLAADVEPLLAKLTMPTLVMHPRDYRMLKSEESSKLAARIPNAHLVLLDGTTRLGEPDECMGVIERFLRDLPSRHRPPVGSGSREQPDALSPREREVLRLLATGKSNAQIAEALVISLNTVRRHVSNIYAKIEVANRAPAAVFAKERGLV